MVDAVQLGSALSGCLSPDTAIRKSSENVIEHVRDEIRCIEMTRNTVNCMLHDNDVEFLYYRLLASPVG